MRGRNLKDLALVAIYLALAIVPAIGIYVRAAQIPLAGAVAPVRRVSLTLPHVLDESYQQRFGEWFEGRLGLRGAAVLVDGTILLHVFGETKPEARVKVGSDGILYELDDLYYFSKSGDALPTAELADRFAATVAEIQRRLQARGRAFVPVIAPAKTSFYRAEIPAAWVKAPSPPPPSDDGVYGRLRRAFDARGVRYVDGRAVMLASPAPRPQLWAADARHWSGYGACITMREVIAAYTALTTRAASDYQCRTVMEPRPMSDVDHDLSLLMNAVRPPVAPAVAVVLPPDPVPTGWKPRTLFIGTSFSSMLFDDARRSAALARLDRNYYNNTFMLENGEHVPVEAGTDTWRGLTLDADLYVLELLETYALSPDSYSLAFVDQLLAALPPP